jgi:hypothetical protein
MTMVSDFGILHTTDPKEGAGCSRFQYAWENLVTHDKGTKTIYVLGSHSNFLKLLALWNRSPVWKYMEVV